MFAGLMTTTLGALQAGGMFQFSPGILAAQGAASYIVTLLDSTPSIGSDIQHLPRQPDGKKTSDEKAIIERIEAKKWPMLLLYQSSSPGAEGDQLCGGTRLICGISLG
ncbi:hypothetical protein D9756_010555 [Leucocoprinus leucothites]|uniref:Uncharacterized protein n=1 Tax=Leucocoprinus leucothites TaxID=201217 RepID=A0A8H5CRU7_9AGAR|nr:hypothetical protein D9756_010555 [Leucoagaricus leucothites]